MGKRKEKGKKKEKQRKEEKRKEKKKRERKKEKKKRKKKRMKQKKKRKEKKFTNSRFHDFTISQGAKGVLSYYNGKLSEAIIELFPNIGLRPQWDFES
jgi:outer membrane biosynthesis protein TonB